MKPLSLNDFKKLVRQQGWKVVHSTKHHMVVDAGGLVIFRFAVSHAKCKKQEVKGVYVKQFLKLIEQHKE